MRCYFYKINLKQSGFSMTYSFKILVPERKYFLQFSYISCLCNILLRNPVDLPRLSENLCFFKSVLSSCSQNTGSVTRDHIKSSQVRTKRLYNYKAFPSCRNKHIFFFRSQILQCFSDVLAGCKL